MPLHRTVFYKKTMPLFGSLNATEILVNVKRRAHKLLLNNITGKVVRR